MNIIYSTICCSITFHYQINYINNVLSSITTSKHTHTHTHTHSMMFVKKNRGEIIILHCRIERICNVCHCNLFVYLIFLLMHTRYNTLSLMTISFVYFISTIMNKIAKTCMSINRSALIRIFVRVSRTDSNTIDMNTTISLLLTTLKNFQHAEYIRLIIFDRAPSSCLLLETRMTFVLV
jgi:hypothetical protein